MAESERRDATDRPPATPGWVKVIGIALLIVLVLAAIILAVGGGRHGPGMHGSAIPAHQIVPAVSGARL
jgi:hypothetical protein